MKKTLFLCLVLLFSKSIFAQDACTELMKFNDYTKNINRTYRMTSKTPAVNQTQIMERDKIGNIHQTMTMDMPGQSMTIESILFGNKLYVKNNGEDWTPQPMDSIQTEALKNQWKNNQLQFYKNCKKLDNETIDGKKYRVYSAEFDPEKMKELMGKSQQTAAAADMMSKMEMSMTMYINDKDDVELTKMTTKVMGQTFSSETDFEYDMPVTICEPAAKKKD